PGNPSALQIFLYFSSGNTQKRPDKSPHCSLLYRLDSSKAPSPGSPYQIMKDCLCVIILVMSQSNPRLPRPKPQSPAFFFEGPVSCLPSCFFQGKFLFCCDFWHR